MPININNIFHTFFKKTPNEVHALNDVSIKIADHDFIAFVGETGSGKSTLVQHLNGLLIPDEGTIEVDEFVVTNNKKKNKRMHQLRNKVGLIFQFPEYQLFEETVIKDVCFGPRNFGSSNEEALNKAKAALALVGIDESYYERSPFELSGGERRKIAIAGILAINPDILVLDEPTAGLDYQASDEVMALVNKLYMDDHKTIILVTHDMNLVYKYANRVCYLKDGKIAFDGTPLALFEKNIDTLELPHLYKFVKNLNEHGYNIDYSSINNIGDVFKYIGKK